MILTVLMIVLNMMTLMMVVLMLMILSMMMNVIIADPLVYPLPHLLEGKIHDLEMGKTFILSLIFLKEKSTIWKWVRVSSKNIVISTNCILTGFTFLLESTLRMLIARLKLSDLNIIRTGWSPFMRRWKSLPLLLRAICWRRRKRSA